MNPGCKLAIIAVAALMPLAATAQPSSADEAARMARDALDRLMGTLGAAIGSIPQYSAPEILPNGDIIIRRKPRADDVPAAPAPPDQRKT